MIQTAMHFCFSNRTTDAGECCNGMIINSLSKYYMTLIKSISGIRGTIGGAPGEGLSPLDIVKFTYSYL